MVNGNTLLIWDFDDTIVKTNIEYEKTNKETAMIVANAIYGKEKNINEILIHQRRADHKLVHVYGFHPKRYIDSWLETYHFFAKKENVPISDSTNKNILNTVNDLYTRKFQEIPYAVSTLSELKQQGYPMIVLTAGVDSIQRKKIKETGIEHLFNDIYVRVDKNPEVLREILKNYNADEYVMIGNSLKSDIYPALENNIWAFHIERKTWSVDDYPIDRNHPKYIHLKSITEVPKKIKLVENQLSISV